MNSTTISAADADKRRPNTVLVLRLSQRKVSRAQHQDKHQNLDRQRLLRDCQWDCITHICAVQWGSDKKYGEAHLEGGKTTKLILVVRAMTGDKKVVRSMSLDIRLDISTS